MRHRKWKQQKKKVKITDAPTEFLHIYIYLYLYIYILYHSLLMMVTLWLKEMVWERSSAQEMAELQSHRLWIQGNVTLCDKSLHWIALGCGCRYRHPSVSGVDVQGLGPQNQEPLVVDCLIYLSQGPTRPFCSVSSVRWTVIGDSAQKDHFMWPLVL